MNKIALIANREMYYDARMVQAEEPFECEERFVEVLTRAGSARLAPPAEHAQRPKRRYQRRDMVAEDK